MEVLQSELGIDGLQREMSISAVKTGFRILAPDASNHPDLARVMDTFMDTLDARLSQLISACFQRLAHGRVTPVASLVSSARSVSSTECERGHVSSRSIDS